MIWVCVKHEHGWCQCTNDITLHVITKEKYFLHNTGSNACNKMQQTILNLLLHHPTTQSSFFGQCHHLTQGFLSAAETVTSYCMLPVTCSGPPPVRVCVSAAPDATCLPLYVSDKHRQYLWHKQQHGDCETV